MTLPYSLTNFIPFRLYLVHGESMEPAIRKGTKVLVNRLSGIRVGDVIALRHPQKNLVILKRITQIKDDGYVVEGDNKEKSSDSRQFGLIEKKLIIGKVVAIL